jgi:hypothetical protein
MLLSRYGLVRIAGGRVIVIQITVGKTNTHGILRRREVPGSPITSDNGTDWLGKGVASIESHNQVERTFMEKCATGRPLRLGLP